MATRSRKEHYEIRSGRNNGRAVSYAWGVEGNQAEMNQERESALAIAALIRKIDSCSATRRARRCGEPSPIIHGFSAVVTLQREHYQFLTVTMGGDWLDKSVKR